MSVTPPKVTNQRPSPPASPEAATSAVRVDLDSSVGERHGARLLVVDLTGDESAARDWAAHLIPGADITIIHKADLKKGARLSVIGDFR
ncbi:MAG TPA: hypothetical protein VFV34_03760, partial [Blastocatellia bacterium]|nr:hypothetical protein [Blastocatellia bacterium]